MSYNIDAQFAATGDNNVDLMDTLSESSQSDNEKEEPFYERIDIIMISLFPFKLGNFHANGKHIIKSVRTLLRKVAIFVSSTSHKKKLSSNCFLLYYINWWSSG